MKKIIILAGIAIASFLLGSSIQAHNNTPQLLAFFVDERFEDGPHWVSRTLWPSGAETFDKDPEPIRIRTSADVTAFFPGTIASEWQPLQEGHRIVWVFHSNRAKDLVPIFGTLDIGRNISPGTAVNVSDATWRFGTDNPPAPQTSLSEVPSTPGDPSSVLGGRWVFVSGNQWKLTGRHLIRGAAGWIVHTPKFPGNPGLPPGETEETDVATAYKQ